MENLRITKERKRLGLSQAQLASKLNISQKSISKYECGTRRPSYETLLAMSSIFGVSVDYLLGREDSSGQGLNEGDIEKRGLDGDGITHMLGHTEDEEKAVSFSNKLALQIDFNGSKLADVANAIGVPIKTVLEWLYEKRDDYPQYYEKLSEYFNVELTYWTRPGAVSPGIEPTTDEYFLIMRYRRQNYPKEMEYMPPIECFFPNCRELSESELDWLELSRCSELSDLWAEWLETFKTLSKDDKYILLGEAKKLIKEQQRPSVAADSAPLRKTGTDSLGK